MAFFTRDDSLSPASPPAAAPAADRELELTRAEQAMRTAEAQLLAEAERVALEAVAVTERARTLEREASGFEEHPDIAALLLQLREPTPVPAVAAHVERALSARLQALEVRRKAAEALKSTLKACGEVVLDRSRSASAGAAMLAQARAEAVAAKAAAAAATRRVPSTPPGEGSAVADLHQAVPAAETPADRPASAAPVQGSAIGKVALKRVAARVAMQTQVDLSSDSNFFTGFSTNISEGGLFIATVNVLPAGTPVDVSFTLPAGRRLTVKGEVRWTREVNDRTPDVFPGVGVRFTDVDPAVVSQIKTFVQQREPLFFPD
jgi:uncharacterized protein (TIGR02266 family)